MTEENFDPDNKAVFTAIVGHVLRSLILFVVVPWCTYSYVHDNIAVAPELIWGAVGMTTNAALFLKVFLDGQKSKSRALQTIICYLVDYWTETQSTRRVSRNDLKLSLYKSCSHPTLRWLFPERLRNDSAFQMPNKNNNLPQYPSSVLDEIFAYVRTKPNDLDKLQQILAPPMIYGGFPKVHESMFNIGNSVEELIELLLGNGKFHENHRILHLLFVSAGFFEHYLPSADMRANPNKDPEQVMTKWTKTWVKTVPAPDLMRLQELCKSANEDIEAETAIVRKYKQLSNDTKSPLEVMFWVNFFRFWVYVVNRHDLTAIDFTGTSNIRDSLKTQKKYIKFTIGLVEYFLGVRRSATFYNNYFVKASPTIKNWIKSMSRVFCVLTGSRLSHTSSHCKFQENFVCPFFFVFFLFFFFFESAMVVIQIFVCMLNCDGCRNKPGWIKNWV